MFNQPMVLVPLRLSNPGTELLWYSLHGKSHFLCFVLLHKTSDTFILVLCHSEEVSPSHCWKTYIKISLGGRKKKRVHLLVYACSMRRCYLCYFFFNRRSPPRVSQRGKYKFGSFDTLNKSIIVPTSFRLVAGDPVVRGDYSGTDGSHHAPRAASPQTGTNKLLNFVRPL